MVNRSTDGKPEQSAGPRGRESAAARRERAAHICRRLAEAFPGAVCSLDFQSPFQLLVATILSAQCTDRRVNMVTGPLFRRWSNPARLAAAAPPALEAAIRSTGFFRAKAKSILGCCQALQERHGGEVPRTLEELVRLPGVGRKTANVVLGSAFGLAEGVVVACLPRDHWIAFSHRLIELGRTVCTARRPRCGACPLADLCPRKGVSLAPARR